MSRNKKANNRMVDTSGNSQEVAQPVENNTPEKSDELNKSVPVQKGPELLIGELLLHSNNAELIIEVEIYLQKRRAMQRAGGVYDRDQKILTALINKISKE